MAVSVLLGTQQFYFVSFAEEWSCLSGAPFTSSVLGADTPHLYKERSVYSRQLAMVWPCAVLSMPDNKSEREVKRACL